MSTVAQAGRPAIFLDRDGVLNKVTVVDGTPLPPDHAEQLELLPGVADACQRLKELGYVLVVVTNQPDIARGKQSQAEVDRMHLKLRSWLPLDEVVVCAHDDSDGCGCRKPLPGMLVEAAKRLELDLSSSFCIGDRWRDVEAAHRAGVTAIYIDRNYGERKATGAAVTVGSLADALPFVESRHIKGDNR